MPTSEPDTSRRLRLAAAALTIASVVALGACRDTLEVDRHSAYSHIRIRRAGDIRGLYFVRDSGVEVSESKVDLSEPRRLVLPYTRSMFASYLFVPQQERVVIIGLGGGAMVHFLEHHDPDLQIEAVEIDPVVVQLADEYFDVRTRGSTTIVTADGLAHLQGTEQRYDVIYMDAFLKPSEVTDGAGVPQAMKTEAFYTMLQSKLTAKGVVVFNLNRYADTERDVEAIESAFLNTAIFSPAGSINLVVVGCTAGAWADAESIASRARELDQRFDTDFSFQDLWSSRRSP